MIKKYSFILIGAAVGLLAGYAYYYFVGCASGTCAITSKPINSSLYGAVMGGLLGDTVKSFVNKKVKTDSKDS